jgi:hypothetical protein
MKSARPSAHMEDLARDALASIMLFFDTPRVWVALQKTCSELYASLHDPDKGWGMNNVVFKLNMVKIQRYLSTFLSDKRFQIRNVVMEYVQWRPYNDDGNFSPTPHDDDDQYPSDDYDGHWFHRPGISKPVNEKREKAKSNHDAVFAETLFYLLWQCPIRTLTILEMRRLTNTLSMERIIEALTLPTCTVRYLYIPECPINVSRGMALVQNYTIKGINLYIAAENTSLLCCLKQNVSLERLDLTISGKINAQGIHLIAESLPRCLKHLILKDDVSGSDVSGDEVDKMLAKILGSTCKDLTHLGVYITENTPCKIQNFASVLAENKTLESLELCSLLDADAVHTFAKVVQTHPRLQNICMNAGGNLRHIEACAIGDAMVDNKNLRSLTICSCYFSDGSASEIVNALRRGSRLNDLGECVDCISVK